jgi:type II secretory pathway component PulC
MRNFLVAVLALPTFAAAAAPETNYRLAGIVAAGSDSFMAVIELPDGRQQLFRAGDVLGNGKIREITSTGALIELAGRGVGPELAWQPEARR